MFVCVCFLLAKGETLRRRNIAQTSPAPCRLGENVTLQKRDWHEAIDFYAEPGPDKVELGRFAGWPANMHESKLAEVRGFVHGRNLWPDKPAGFRRHAETYFAQMRRVGDGLMDAARLDMPAQCVEQHDSRLPEAMAVALSLPESYFRALTNQSFWCARVIGYPALAEGAEVGLSCGEHSDYGCWTILCQAIRNPCTSPLSAARVLYV